MTEQEQQLITGLADRIKNAPAPQMDRDADDLIRRTIGSRPDALYILTQTVLIQEMALNQAKVQIEDLKQKAAAAQQGAPQGGFLPAGQRPAQSGAGQSGDWGRDSRVQQPSAGQTSGYQNQAYEPPPPQSGGGFSHFLRSAATTAAGVVAGEIAFESLSSLFGHRGGYYGGGGFFGGGPGISPGSETIINNYYGDERGERGDRGDRYEGDDGSRFAAAADDRGGTDVSSDIEDERDVSADSADDLVDDSSSDSADNLDDSSFDDGGSFDDDSGSF